MVETEVSEYKVQLARVIENELVVQSESIDCAHELEQMDALALALSQRSELQVHEARRKANIASIRL
jgi:hypothetical protein